MSAHNNIICLGAVIIVSTLNIYVLVQKGIYCNDLDGQDLDSVYPD